MQLKDLVGAGEVGQRESSLSAIREMVGGLRSLDKKRDRAINGMFSATTFRIEHSVFARANLLTGREGTSALYRW